MSAEPRGGRERRKEVMSLRHVRLANAVCSRTPGSARKGEHAELCLVDYASCPVSDVCWIVDFDSGCDQRDNCLIDTS